MAREYYVGIGGTPTDRWVEAEDFGDALVRALEMALEMAESEGIDTDTIDTWGEDDPDIGAGACPDGDPGGYWPYVMILEK